MMPFFFIPCSQTAMKSQTNSTLGSTNLIFIIPGEGGGHSYTNLPTCPSLLPVIIWAMHFPFVLTCHFLTCVSWFHILISSACTCHYFQCIMLLLIFGISLTSNNQTPHTASYSYPIYTSIWKNGSVIKFQFQSWLFLSLSHCIC